MLQRGRNRQHRVCPSGRGQPVKGQVFRCNVDFFDIFSSTLIWLALGFSTPALVASFSNESYNGASAVEMTVGTTVFVGAWGYYLSIEGILATAIASLAGVAIAMNIRARRRRWTRLVASILCLGIYLRLK